MRYFGKTLVVSSCLLLSSLLLAPTANGAPANTVSPAKADVAERYGNLPLSFEANRGQTDSQVRFLSRGNGYSFFLTPTEAVLTLARDAHSEAAVLRMQLAGANPDTRIQGVDPLPGTSNYFFGSDASRWRTGVPTYSKVAYENVYPGINLVYYGNQQQLEYDFVVAPGADPRQIRLNIAGAQKLTVDAQGNLVLRSAGGEVQLLAPRVYQQVNGSKHNIAGRWVLAANHSAGFRLGAYDHTLPLVIDPVLMYSSFLGGSQQNAINRIVIDTAGNAYVAGYTASGDFPAAPTPQLMSFGGGTAGRGAFVAKIDPTGSTLLYSTYLSGSANGEQATGLAVDNLGNVYLTGNTHSTDFPTYNAFQSACPTHNQAGTCSSAFLTKISSTGDSLVFSTYLGGSGGESARSLAVDAAGSAYVAGITSSLDFPVTALAAQSKCGGSCQQNAFVAKFAPSGGSLAYASYLGGSGVDDAADIAVDASGSAYVTGKTTSADFPLSTPFLKSCAPDATSSSGACVATAFVTKLKADGSAFAYSTYLGGTLGSQASAIAVDTLGSAYVTGSTQSADFPVASPFQKSCGIDKKSGLCSLDAFVTKLAPSGRTLVYSTYLGGSGSDQASGIVVDAKGNVSIVGSTKSADFPTISPVQSKLKGASDAFVARFNAAGSSLTFSTYHGGSAAESGSSVAVDTKGNIYVAGATSSTDFPTQHPFQSSCAGACSSAFVSKMSAPPPAGTTASTTTLTNTPNITTYFENVTLSAIVSGTSGVPTGTVNFLDGATLIGTGTLDGTGATDLIINTLTVGGHTITANYLGDATYATSTDSATQTVNQATTTTTLVSSANPSTYLQSVTFTATVTGANGGAPTGTVTFKDGATTLGTGTLATVAGSQQASYTTTTLSVATHSITAVYAGDTDFITSTSSALSQVVNKAATTTTLASSANPSTFNQSVTFTATVTGANGGAPSGTVTFKDGATTLGTGTLATVAGAQQATFTTTTLSVATHSITAVYAGDTSFIGSTSSALSEVVNKAATVTTVASSANPSAFNQSVTFTATVTGANGGAPSGTVTFKDGATTLGTGTLATVAGSQQATYTTSTLSVGTHSITAVYGGDTNFTTSTSTTLSQVVGKAATTTTVASSVNPSAFNQSVTFTATVTGTNGGTPTGTVTFMDGATTLGTGTLATVSGSQQATYTTTALAVGSHSITATYGGDTSFATSTSSTLSQVVGKAATSTALVSSLNPSTVNQSVTFTATVTSSGTNLTGTVTFNDNGTAISGAVTINGSGVATFTTSTLVAATHPITAVYSGDTSYSGSTSPTVSQVVNKGTTTTALLSSPNPSTVNQQVTFTATVTPTPSGTINPGGTVNFNDGGTTIGTGTLNASLQATFSTAALAVGSHSITAVYVGDSNFTGSTSSAVTQVVNQTATTTTVASSNSTSNINLSVTFTATVTPAVYGTYAPSGTVTFMDGTTAIGTETLATVAGIQQATFTTAGLALGTHSITAVYAGDSSFTGSTSSVLTQKVQQTGTTTALAYVVGLDQNITFTATVTPLIVGPFVPTGTVNFVDGATVIGSGTLNGSLVATFTTTTPFAPGTHSITATYIGDTNFITSTSAATAITFTAVAAQSGVIAGGPTAASTLTNVAAGGTTVTYSCLSLAGTGITAPLAPSPSPGVFTGATDSNSSGVPLNVYCYFSPAASAIAPNTVSLVVCTAASPTCTAPGVPAAQRKASLGLGSALLTQSMGFLGIVFLGMGTSVVRSRRVTRKGITRCLGAWIAISLLLLFVGCSGGFAGMVVPPTTSAGSTPAGTYSLTVLGTGSDGSSQVYTVPFTVTAPQ